MAEDEMRVLMTTGVEFLEVTDPTERSTVGQHWNAVRTYLNTGDDSRLRQFEGETVAVRLETDLDTIDELARRGELDFPDIYES
jgi:hypothetical protein